MEGPHFCAQRGEGLRRAFSAPRMAHDLDKIVCICRLACFVRTLHSCIRDARAIPHPSQRDAAAAKVQRAEGALKIDASFTIAFAGYREPRLDRAGQRFLRELHRQTEIVFFSPAKSTGPATLTIAADHQSKPVQELG